MSRVLFSCALAALLLSGPTSAANFELTTFDHAMGSQSASQDWCKDARSYNDEYDTYCEVRDLKESAQRGLDVETGNGSVTITGSSRSDVSVQARIMASAESSAEARDLAKQVTITLENGRLRATGPTSRRRQSWWVSYRAEVPAKYDLALDASNGSINVTGVHGDIDAETANGSIRLTDLGGRVRARTSNGSTHVLVSGSRWDGDGLTVITSNGSARLDLPSSYNAQLVVGSNNGSLNVDFPVMVQGQIGRRLETTIGSGGPTLEVRTSNGSVRVSRR